MKAVIWDIESDDELPYHCAKTDHAYIAIDSNNGVLRLNDYDLNGSHGTSMLFIGPKADDNAAKFETAIEAEGEEGLDMNCDTVKLIKKCFGLK